MIRILICDDSPFMRQLITDAVASQPDLEVVGTAKNGLEGVAMCAKLKPDLVTLDIEMPQMDGLTALGEIMKVCPTRVLMVSTLTTKGATETVKALGLGAVDFFAKPNNGSLTAFQGARDELLDKIRSAAAGKIGAPIKAGPRVMSLGKSDHVVLIASSTGGPKALQILFETLPKGFSAPVLMVQHMPQGFTAALAKRLSTLGAMPVVEGVPGMKVEPGVAIIAPGGHHMLVNARGTIELNQAPTIHGVRPAADYLFSTTAAAFGSRCLGAVLTGMGRDGAEGALAVRNAGGTVFGEAESTCTVYGMPRSANQIGAVHQEYPIDQMAAAITAACAGKVARAS